MCISNQIGWPRSNLKMDATLRKWKIAKITLFCARCLWGLCHKFENDQKAIAVRTENIDCCWRTDLSDFWEITPSWFVDKLDFSEFVWHQRFCVENKQYLSSSFDKFFKIWIVSICRLWYRNHEAENVMEHLRCCLQMKFYDIKRMSRESFLVLWP